MEHVSHPRVYVEGSGVGYAREVLRIKSKREGRARLVLLIPTDFVTKTETLIELRRVGAI